MSFNIPNTFIAGTKAKADEVNENFSAIESELNAQSVNIQTVKKDLDDTNKYIKSDLIVDVKDIVSDKKTKFCVNYGNLDENSNEDLISFEQRIVSFKVGATYPVLIATNAYGDTETFEAVDDIDLSGYEDGSYNIFLDLDGTVEVLKNNIYTQLTEPQNAVISDVWFMELEPEACYKFNGISWLDYEKIPLGNVVISGSAITKVKTFRYNRAGVLNRDCTNITLQGRKNLSRRYESDWSYVNGWGSYMFTHNLNLAPEKCTLKIYGKFTRATARWAVGNIICIGYANQGGDSNYDMGFAPWMTNDSVTIICGSHYALMYIDKGSHEFVQVPKDYLLWKVVITEDIVNG